MPLPTDYDERVYAGWLGKCIGVRFGAPLENWTYEEIRDNLGELTTYLREDRGQNLQARRRYRRADDPDPRPRRLRRGRHRRSKSARRCSTISATSMARSGGAVTASRPNTPPISTSPQAFPRRVPARSPRTAQRSPSKSAGRFSATSGAWSRPTIPPAPPTSPPVPHQRLARWRAASKAGASSPRWSAPLSAETRPATG